MLYHPDHLKSGQINAAVLELIKQKIKSGVTGLELDQIADQEIAKRQAKPAFKGFNGYQYATCISVNEVLVHGLPSSRPFKSGDVISIDLGVDYHGWLTDAAITVALSPIRPEIDQLIIATKQALDESFAVARHGHAINDIAAVIEKIARKNSLGIAHELTGHGISHTLHEPPIVPNYIDSANSTVLKEGMIIAIEPMFALRPNGPGTKASVKTAPDGWSLGLDKGNIGAHFEHTIVITRKAPIVLTEIVDITD